MMGSQAYKYYPHQFIDYKDVSSRLIDLQEGIFVSNQTIKSMQYNVFYPAGNLPVRYLQSVNVKSTRHVDQPSPTVLALPTTALEQFQPKYAEPLVVRQETRLPEPRFVTLQKWEGMVLKVSSDAFIARLVDQTNQGPDNDAEFALEEIDQQDRQLIKPGAIFYWTLGYSDSPSGQRNRVSFMRFRRLPAWRTNDLEKAREEARRWGDLIGWK